MNDKRWVFIVHIWHEPDPQLTAPVLRGSFQVLGATQLRYFDSLEALLRLLQTALNAPPPADSLIASTLPSFPKE